MNRTLRRIAVCGLTVIAIAAAGGSALALTYVASWLSTHSQISDAAIPALDAGAALVLAEAVCLVAIVRLSDSWFRANAAEIFAILCAFALVAVIGFEVLATALGLLGGARIAIWSFVLTHALATAPVVAIGSVLIALAASAPRDEVEAPNEES